MRDSKLALTPGRDGKNLHEAGGLGSVGFFLGLQCRFALHSEGLFGRVELLNPERTIVDEGGDKAAEDENERFIGLRWYGHCESPFAAPVAQGARP